MAPETPKDTKPNDTTIHTASLEANPSTSPHPPTQPRSKFRITLILLALFLSLFVAALDATIVATAVPVISHELNSASGYLWVGAAYLIGNAVGAPIWAKLSDIWGRKNIMLAAVAIFFAASAICGSAKEMRTLIAGRALQGLAGGGLMLLVHVVISDLFSMKQRSLLMGITEGVWAAAGGIGPPLGGVFASLATWRWCFYLNLPICFLAFTLLFFFLDVPHSKTSFRAGVAALDWWGLFTFLSFTLMVLLGLDFGGVVFAWSSARVICLIVIGTCMLGAFIYSEAKLAKHPLIPLTPFKEKESLAALAVAAFHGLAFMPGEFYVPLYLQAVMQKTPLMSGVLLVPLVVATAAVGVLAGFIIHRTGRFRELIWAGTAILTIALGTFITLDANASLGKFIALSIVFGLGAGLLFEAPLIALQTRSKQKHIATATSTLVFVRGMAVAISVIIGGAVFQNSMDVQAERLVAAGLPESITSRLSGKEAAANVAIVGQLDDRVQRELVEQAFAGAMRNMWVMYTVLAGLGFVAALFVGKAEEGQMSSVHVETVTGIKGEEVGLCDDVELT